MEQHMTTDIRHTVIDSPVGELTLVAAGNDLTGVYFTRRNRSQDGAFFGEQVEPATDSILAQAADQLDEYFAGHRTAFNLSMKLHGDAFQARIWELLNDIPYGETVSYGEIAARYGDKQLARNVGQAVGSNPISVIVPCHRVIGKDGSLVGYGGGLDRKRTLLALEGAACMKPELRTISLPGL